MYWHNVSFLKPLGQYLLEQGLPPAAYLRRHGLPATLLLEDGDAWVRRDTSLRMADGLCRLAGDPWAGLQALRPLRIEDCGSWGRLVAGCRRFDDALETARRNIGRLLTGTSLIIEDDGDRIRLGLRLEGVLQADPRQHHLSALLLLRKLVALAGASVSTTAHLPGPVPDHADDIVPLLGPDPVFRAAWHHLAVPRDILSRPLSVAPPAAGRRVRAERVRSTAHAVLAEVRRTIPMGRPTVVAIAADLGLSVRTLQRNLQSWGVTFEELVDEFRRHQALNELSRGDLPITEIGFRLGYSDPAHFSRAVRRWAGCCPRDLRVGAVRPAAAEWLAQGAPPTTMPEPPPGAGTRFASAGAQPI